MIYSPYNNTHLSTSPFCDYRHTILKDLVTVKGETNKSIIQSLLFLLQTFGLRKQRNPCEFKPLDSETFLTECRLAPYGCCYQFNKDTKKPAPITEQAIQNHCATTRAPMVEFQILFNYNFTRTGRCYNNVYTFREHRHAGFVATIHLYTRDSVYLAPITVSNNLVNSC